MTSSADIDYMAAANFLEENFAGFADSCGSEKAAEDTIAGLRAKAQDVRRSDPACRFRSLLAEIHELPERHPGLFSFADDRESVPWRHRGDEDDGWDEFGLAFWTLILMAIRSVLRKAISECGDEMRPLLERALSLVENSDVNRRMRKSGKNEAAGFRFEVSCAACDIEEAMDRELYDDWPRCALALLDAYAACLGEDTDVFCRFRWDGPPELITAAPSPCAALSPHRPSCREPAAPVRANRNP